MAWAIAEFLMGGLLGSATLEAASRSRGDAGVSEDDANFFSKGESSEGFEEGLLAADDDTDVNKALTEATMDILVCSFFPFLLGKSLGDWALLSCAGVILWVGVPKDLFMMLDKIQQDRICFYVMSVVPHGSINIQWHPM